MVLEPVTFADLTGWQRDDHEAALAAFLKSDHILREAYPGLVDPRTVSDVSARDYFETHFKPYRSVSGADGFFTGYYEPVLGGSRYRSARFHVPLLRRPDDLETLVDDALRASSGDRLTHARRTSAGLEPFPVRAEIEQGCLDGQGLEFIYLDDPVDAFFLHVQGSGLIELDDGSRVRVSYAAKNGHPYTSVGKWLIEQGTFRAEDMSLQNLSAWLRAQPDGGRPVLWRNQSYIFFEELGAADKVSIKGTRGIALSAGRSLAIDASIHRLGLPVYVAASGLPDGAGGADFCRLMVAQDVGSAIRGPGRGDIFFGTGPEAGHIAGRTKHAGEMFVLLPRAVEAAVRS